jgi:hypothetical protein
MTGPVRIQRKRTKGFKLISPNGLPIVCVGRGSRWGNPFVVGRDGTAAECVNKYADMLLPYRHHGPNSNLFHLYISEANLEDIQLSLRGKNLACWCKEGTPCHADVLLELANAS